MKVPTAAPAADVLDSWKAVAQYLQRDVRTLQRWEATKELPVHRMPGGERSGVWALKSELDAWRRKGQIHVAETGGRPIQTAEPQPECPSVAVLPFANLSDDKDNEYFADGLADEIITALSRIHGLRVTARTSSFAFRGKEQDIRKIASSLGTGAILEGAVRRSGSRVRVTAQLIDGVDGFHRWGDCYDREFTETFAIQEDISAAIVDALRGRLSTGARPMRRQTANAEAYQLWLEGRHYCIRQTPHDLLRSRRAFEQAAALDPAYPQAQLGIAESWWTCAALGMESAREAVSIGRCAASRVLAADPDCGEAHALMGVFAGAHDFDWAAAERWFRQAIECSPASADIRLQYAAYMLEPVGRLAEARTQLEAALSYDPLSPIVLAYLGQCVMFQGQLEDAVEIVEEAAALDPDYWLPRFLLFGAYAFQGKLDRSIAIAESALASLGTNSIILGAAGVAYGLTGQHAQAEECLRRIESLGGMRYVSPLGVAWCHLGLRNVDACLDWLEKAVEERDPQVIHFKVKALYDGFRQHPRFVSILGRTGLA